MSIVLLNRTPKWPVLPHMHHWMRVPGSQDTRRHKRYNVSNMNIVTAFVPPHQKKGGQTCWSFLLILLTLVAMVELRKGLRGLLQPRHKDLYVIQGAV